MAGDQKLGIFEPPCDMQNQSHDKDTSCKLKNSSVIGDNKRVGGQRGVLFIETKAWMEVSEGVLLPFHRA